MADDDAPQIDIAGAIKAKIAESVQNFDVISMMQKIVAVSPDDEEGEEVRNNIQSVLAKYTEMSDEEKAQFTKQMKDVLMTKLSSKLGEQNINLDGLQDAIKEAIVYKLIFVGVGVVVLILVIVFFGYKLYRSLKDKELKKEEKKKAKQMKKKK